MPYTEDQLNDIFDRSGGDATGGLVAGPVGALAVALFGGIAGNRSRPR